MNKCALIMNERYLSQCYQIFFCLDNTQVFSRIENYVIIIIYSFALSSCLHIEVNDYRMMSSPMATT